MMLRSSGEGEGSRCSGLTRTFTCCLSRKVQFSAAASVVGVAERGRHLTLDPGLACGTGNNRGGAQVCVVARADRLVGSGTRSRV